MVSESNNDILYSTIDGTSIGCINGPQILAYSIRDIPVWKKRKTIVKYLMSIGFSKNYAEEEARWIKLNRKLLFLYNQADQYVIDEIK